LLQATHCEYYFVCGHKNWKREVKLIRVYL
jgi:hypothetical protein